MATDFCWVDGSAGKLECQVANHHSTFKQAILILSPYPQMGGTMSFGLNRVLFYYFLEHPYLVSRFNYRGVGRSEGTYGHHLGEYDDTKSVATYLIHQYPSIQNLHLIGYSFGSALAASLVQEELPISSYIGISPPFQLFSDLFQPLKSVTLPKLFLIGNKDQFTHLELFQTEILNYTNVSSKVFPNVDHFWEPQEEHVAQFIFQWLKTHPNIYNSE